jgi:TatD DNase family protein
MLVDSHCHLDFSEFDATLDTVIRDAHAADVRYMLAISARRSQLDKVRQITRDNDGIFFAAGTHPLHIQEEIPYNVEELQAMATDDKMIAIGETGLDFHYKKDTAEQQFSSFLNHIKAAQTTNLPLVIHARNADDAMGDILKKEYQRKPFAFVLHCFSSEKRLAEIAVDCGAFLSMSGIVTFSKSNDIREVFSEIVPIDRVLVETDSPYLAPAPMRGRRNEPAFVQYVAQKGAEIYGMDYKEFCHKTTENFFDLFTKAKK